jgi:hypothetical protein
VRPALRWERVIADLLEGDADDGVVLADEVAASIDIDGPGSPGTSDEVLRADAAIPLDIDALVSALAGEGIEPVFEATEEPLPVKGTGSELGTNSNYALADHTHLGVELWRVDAEADLDDIEGATDGGAIASTTGATKRGYFLLAGEWNCFTHLRAD